MVRAFTAQESREIETAQDGLRDARFDVDGPGATHNAKLILDYFSQNPSLPVTADNIYRFIKQNATSFVWLSPAAAKYYAVARASDEELVSAAVAWLNGNQHLLLREGDPAYENLTAILEELRGWQFSERNVQAAIGRAQMKNKKLHFEPTRSQDSYLNNPRRHTDEPIQKNDDGPRYVHGRLDHASVKPPVTERPPERAKDSWERVCELLVQNGKSHSEKLEFQQIVDAHRAEGSSWREIGAYLQRLQHERSKRMNWAGAV